MKSTSLVRAGVLSALMVAGAAYAGEMSIYSAPNFRGGELTLNGTASNLDRSGFNDRSESIIVRSGRWEVCTDANFAGYCTTLGPGDYRLLEGPLYRRISSAREIAPLAYNDRRYYRYDEYPRAAAPAYVAPAYDSPLVVYTLPGFRGEALRFDSNGMGIDTRSVDQPAASLVVREGTWELCSNMDYPRTCRVYEPGRYPRLGAVDGAPVGSLRRIG